MPKIIKSGVNYTPDISVPRADGITILDSEGVFSAVQQEIPQPDEITIKYNEKGELEAIKQPQATPDWFAQESSEGFIENKPPVNWNGDENIFGTTIGDTSNNEATGFFSVAEGQLTKAVGNYSHAEGYQTKATGNYSHAEGQSTEAVGANSHAEGIGTVTPNIMGAHVQGRYNSNLYNDNFVDIVGWGTGASTSQRKNISALTADGRLILANSITINADKNSHGGYTLPIPAEFNPGQQYMMSYEVDEATGELIFSWSPITIEENKNTYGYNGATTANPGPFTIYDGTTEPSASLGKVGDIYFKHS